MRAAVRPWLFLVGVCAATVVAQLQAERPGEIELAVGNYLGWSKNSPAATPGGVDVTVTVRPGAGYTCTSIVVRVIDDTTGATLDTITLNNPASPATASFTGLGNNRRVQVRVDATFQAGNLFDSAQLTASIITK